MTDKPIPKPLDAFTGAYSIQIKSVKVSKAAATRINPMTHIAAWCGVTKGQKAAR